MLTLKNISKSFNRQDRATIQNLSLCVNAEEFCVIIGSNGCGKSTLMRIIQGEYQADSGKIFLEEKDITKMSLSDRANQISMISQDLSVGIVQELTMLENLCLSQLRGQKAKLRCYNQEADFFKQKVASLGVGLEKFLNAPLKGLSGGQKQMVSFIMSLLSKPKLLILDEHCSALDPKASQMLMEKTSEIISQQKLTSLMITHNLKDALTYGDRLMMMHQGKIVEDFSKAEKAKLSIKELLDLFHHYEDLSFGVKEDEL